MWLFVAKLLLNAKNVINGHSLCSAWNKNLANTSQLIGPNSGGQATFYSGHKITVFSKDYCCFSKGLSALQKQPLEVFCKKRCS